MPDTFIKIASVTVGSGGAASMAFTSIPSTYTDLVLKISARGTTASTTLGVRMTVNGSTSTFIDKYLQGSGSAAASGNDVGGTFWYLGEMPGSTSTASTFGNIELMIPNYTSANYKSVSVDGVSEGNITTVYSTLVAGLWSTTTAISSITLSPPSNNFAQYSTATLYGISNT